MANLDSIVCPICQGSLVNVPGGHRCIDCKRTYPTEPGAGLDLRCEDLLGPTRPRWTQAQELGAVAYLQNPESNCSRWLGDGQYARAFGEFCQLSGRVLDVGCGPYGPYSLTGSAPETEFVGVDPLVNARAPRSYRALAEFLPLPSTSFDHVIMVSSLDHVADPALALNEAHRVLVPSGRLHVWTHVHPPRTRRLRVLASAALRRLRQPRRWPTILPSLVRAVAMLRRSASEPDEHHMRLLGLDETRELMSHAGFKVDRESSHDDHIFFLSARRVGPQS